MPVREGSRGEDSPGEKYERDIGFATYIPSIILILVIAIGIGVAITQHNLSSQSKENGFIIRESQYKACIKNGNSLRNDVREEFIQLKSKVLVPVFAKIASTIPEGTPSRNILENSVKRMNHRIDTIGQRIPNVHCLEVYPPLEDQTYPNLKDN